MLNRMKNDARVSETAHRYGAREIWKFSQQLTQLSRRNGAVLRLDLFAISVIEI